MIETTILGLNQEAMMSITRHSMTKPDYESMTQLRTMLASGPPMELTPASRDAFDAFMMMVPKAEGVTFEAATVGGVRGVWCRPDDPATDGVVLYLHGGAYVLGSADAYRHVGSQFAARTGAAVFVVDYALAPEQPFPAAFNDARAVYAALSASGPAVALAGDSAGGGLALALLADTTTIPRPVAAAVVSPLTDLTLRGKSHVSRAGADPLLSRDLLVAPAKAYAANHVRDDPRMSPLFAIPPGLPPVLIHVGEDEVLLDDTVRYVTEANAFGNQAEGHVWEGMTHVFTSSFAILQAGEAAMNDICQFLRRHLDVGAAR